MEEGEDSARSSSACLIPLVLLLGVSPFAVQLILMFSHQFPNTSSSLNSLGVTNAGSLKSPSTFIFLAAFIDASSKIISTPDLFDISGESGGLPLGRRSCAWTSYKQPFHPSSLWTLCPFQHGFPCLGIRQSRPI